MWGKGAYNGPGVLIHTNGELIEGIFNNGKLQVGPVLVSHHTVLCSANRVTFE